MSRPLSEHIRHWLDRDRNCACGRSHSVTTRAVSFDDHAGSAVAEFLRSEPRPNGILVVSDKNTRPHANAVFNTLRRNGFTVDQFVFHSTPSATLTADENGVTKLDTDVRADHPACLVGVGSGTINDLCKVVATRHELSYVSCPTAASMNGYTSTVASLKRGGLKVTDPVTAPDAVMVDLDALRRAPPLMTAAGVADLLSKFVTAADWTVARIVEGGYHCDIPAAMAADATDEVVEHLDAIAKCSDEGIRALSAALILSGLSMAVAGNSAPASGGEHLISHYWDMCVPDLDGVRLHGTQVGVGTLICATLYERLREVDPATIDPNAVADSVREFDTLADALRRHFRQSAPAVIEQAARKHKNPTAARTRAAYIKDRWSDILSSAAPLLKSSSEIRNLLRTVGAPTTLDELRIDRNDALEALRWARHIRDRYTVFDLAADVGLFTDDFRSALLDRSGVTTRASAPHPEA